VGIVAIGMRRFGLAVRQKSPFPLGDMRIGKCKPPM
jgi:hypothetical protein